MSKLQEDADAIAREMAANCLAARVRVLSRIVTRTFDEELRVHGLRVTQLNLLVIIAVRGPVRAVDISEAMSFDTSTLSRDIERLIANGWVVAQPGAGRARLLEITRTGKQLLKAVAPAWRAAQERIASELPDRSTQQISQIVDKYWSTERSNE